MRPFLFTCLALALVFTSHDGGRPAQPSAKALAGKEKTAPEWLRSLSDPDPKTRAKAALALKENGAKAVPALVEALQGGDEPTRRGAARALQMLGPAAREAVPALVAVLKDETLHDV